MSVVATHRFSTKDYYRMAETGVLGPEARVELLEGRIIDMSPIGPMHGGVVTRLIQWFTAVSRGRFLVTAQNPVHLDEHSEPQPDLLLLRPARDQYTSRHPRAEDVLLLIEVADTSLAYDRTEKLPAYGRSGIVEVWIVNLAEGAVEVYREPHLAGYNSTTVLRAGDQARPAAFPDAAVDVTQLLQRQ